MNKINENLKTLIPSVLLIVLGVLFCCSLAIGISGLSILIGIILIFAGVMLLINSLINTKTIINLQGILGACVVSMGIIFISRHLAGIIFAFIPCFLITLAICLVLDILNDTLIKKEFVIAKFLTKLIIAIVSLTLGLCLLLINGFMEYSSIVLGIVMIVFGIYLIISALIKK